MTHIKFEIFYDSTYKISFITDIKSENFHDLNSFLWLILNN